MAIKPQRWDSSGGVSDYDDASDTGSVLVRKENALAIMASSDCASACAGADASGVWAASSWLDSRFVVIFEVLLPVVMF